MPCGFMTNVIVVKSIVFLTSNSSTFLIGKMITSGGKKLIAETLRMNVAYLNVQINGCRLLALLATTG